MEAAIQKWGNSHGIRIPKSLLDSLQWKTNTKISLTVKEDKIIVERVNKRKNIKELFVNYEGDYKPSEIDWGEPTGNEIW